MNRPQIHLVIACLTSAALFTGSPMCAAQDSDASAAAGAAAAEPASLSELRTFADVFALVRDSYVDPVSEADLLAAAARGLADSLDEYSDYLGPEAYRRQDEGNRGRQVGIGARAIIDDGKRLVIEDVYPDGPAWMAGVQRGDIILRIDDEPVKGRRLQASLNALAGAPGSEVTLRLQTPGMNPRKLTLERAYVPVPSVRGERLRDGIALVRVDRFNLGTRQEFQAVLDSLRPDGGALAGVIIDLRNNWGGVIRPAAEIADGFLDGGKVVYTRGRYRDSRLEYDALPGQWAEGVPVAVLVNGGSASASEILAGALQDHGRATVVGSRTFGKGTVQSIFRLRNGSALKLTTARYFMPSGRSFDGQGIEPDIAVEEGTRGDRTPVALKDDLALQAALQAFRDGEIAGG
ncbi:MAG: S41 family peptidase [Xanthomonadales bacterium]|jgi:carboxyl-terminal processing protease|nr:S41 family peptidase [Xanthomonadales bacterium]